MAPRSTATKLTPPPGDDLPPTTVLDEADEEEQDDIEAVISQVSDEAATVQVKRWNPTPDDPARPWDYVTTVAAREFSVETIKREYGGGRYKAVTLDRNKKYVRGGTHIFNIDKMFKAQPAASASDAPAAARPEVAALAVKVDQLAALMQAQNSTKETLDMALKIAAVIGGRAAPAMSPDTIFNTATRLVEFSRGLGGGGGEGGGGGDGDDDVYAVAVKELVKPVASLIQSEVERRTRLRVVNPDKRLPAGDAGAEASNMAGMPAWVVQLRPFIPQLLTLARESADPELYADVVYDLLERKLPAAQLQAVEAAAANEAFVDTIMSALPAPCKQYGEWFRKLATNLKAAMTSPPSPGDDEELDEAEGGVAG